MVLPRFCLVAGLASVTLLTACGKAEELKAAGPPAERGIFISTSDCADSGKLTAEQCGQAVDMAVAAHEQQAPTFKSLRLCEAASGVERCEKSSNDQYRARLQAFFVTMSDPPTAVPLYAPAKGKAIGFRSASKQAIDARDETLHVSTIALSLAYDNAKLPEESSDASPIGAAAADVH